MGNSIEKQKKILTDFRGKAIDIKDIPQRFRCEVCFVVLHCSYNEYRGCPVCILKAPARTSTG